MNLIVSVLLAVLLVSNADHSAIDSSFMKEGSSTSNATGTSQNLLGGEGQPRDGLVEIVFTSKYTEYGGESANCEWYDLGDDPDVAGADAPFQCKGYGGYYIYTYFSAYSAHIMVKHSEREYDYYLTEQKIDFIDINRKIEWRFANGEPFCVIFRVKRYNDDLDKRYSQYESDTNSGEELLVRGLQNHERISYNIDTKKTKNANVKAREFADDGFRKTIRSRSSDK